MDLQQLISGRVDTLLVISIILILEITKTTLKAQRVEAPWWVWKYAVLFAGIVAALISHDYSSFSIQTLLVETIVYAGVSTVIYRASKDVIKSISSSFSGNQS